MDNHRVFEKTFVLILDCQTVYLQSTRGMSLSTVYSATLYNQWTAFCCIAKAACIVEISINLWFRISMLTCSKFGIGMLCGRFMWDMNCSFGLGYTMEVYQLRCPVCRVLKDAVDILACTAQDHTKNNKMKQRFTPRYSTFRLFLSIQIVSLGTFLITWS